MKIATWNVNSIRTRLEQVVDWLHENSVDVLCLQETKVVNADFPRLPFEELGYHLYLSGQKSYNGVALLSCAPLEDVSVGFAPILGTGDLDEQKRVITGVLAGVRIVNLYVPNGSAVGSEKYNYKLSWLKTLRAYLQTLLSTQELDASDKGDNSNPKSSSVAARQRSGSERASAIQNLKLMCVCGDFNIAPEDQDIHDPAAFKNSIMASDLERQALSSIRELGLADAFRKFTIEAGHFSWWDYRAMAFRRNWGWRIDHHYLTPTLYERATSCIIDKTPRKLPKPSDHAPVIVEF